MKKLTALFLTLILLCSLAGCGTRQAVRQPDGDDSGSVSRPEPPRAPGISDSEEEPDGAAEPDDAAEPDGAVQPEDFLGSWDDSVYSNGALGIRYTLPEGWLYASDEELLGMMDVALDSGILSDHSQLTLELGKSRIIYAAFVQDPVSGSNVQIMFESLDGLGNQDAISEEAYAESAARQQETFLDESADASMRIGETYRVQLGGQDFLAMPLTLTLSGAEVNEWIYLRRVGDRMSMIIFTSTTDADAETMEGGVSAFAPLRSGASGSSGSSGLLTATGDIGRTFSTMFFDYTVVWAGSPAEYDGYTARSGSKLLVVGVRVKNDFGSTLPMYDTDFQLQWGAGDDDYAWAVDAFNDKMMPLEWELADGEEATYEMLFEVPAGENDFSLVYLEEYTDRFGQDQTGDLYSADFTLPASSAA